MYKEIRKCTEWDIYVCVCKNQESILNMGGRSIIHFQTLDSWTCWFSSWSSSGWPLFQIAKILSLSMRQCMGLCLAGKWFHSLEWDWLSACCQGRLAKPWSPNLSLSSCQSLSVSWFHLRSVLSHCYWTPPMNASLLYVGPVSYWHFQDLTNPY